MSLPMTAKGLHHSQGTLVDFYAQSQVTGMGQILNVLDLPLGIEYRQALPYQLVAPSFACFLN